MKLFPYKRTRIAEGLYVNVSNHFYYNDFGVRDNDVTHRFGRRYINLGTPGTGFIERESESHSYHQFVREASARCKNNYWKLLCGKEPNYDREIVRATAAIATATGRKHEILDCYLNALHVGRSAEYFERVIRGVKDKMGHRSNKYLVSVISHYKNKISQLGHDMMSAEMNVRDLCSDEVYAEYTTMIQHFTRVAMCRRIWHINDSQKVKNVPVFFDMGIFDFIRSEFYLPMMRDSNGVMYFILPDSMIVARNSVDFDVVPLRDLTFVSQELSIEEPIEMLSSRLGDAASMMRIPELGLTFYFNHVRAVLEFEESLNRLKTLQ